MNIEGKLIGQLGENESLEARIPKIPDGEAMMIANVGGSYVLCELDSNKKLNKNSFSGDFVEQAQYDARRLETLYEKILDNETTAYSTTSEELMNLAKNTQNDLKKIVKINGLVNYNINKDDLIGRTVEILENNINTSYTVNFPIVNDIQKSSKKREVKMIETLRSEISRLNNFLDVEKIIKDGVITTYTEGNCIFYLKGSFESGVGVVKYPLEVVEISTLKVDSEPIIAFNVQQLRNKLQSSYRKFGKLKAKNKIQLIEDMTKEIKRDYPEEVYNAFVVGDKYAFLDPSRVGTIRINNFNKPYGVTPIFKALPPLLTLETIDDVDRKTIRSKAKKVFYQKMRKEMIEDQSKGFDLNAVGYSQASLLKAMQDDVVIYTGTPYVEDLNILEPKTDVTDNDTVMSNRNRVLNALGISFMTSESKAGQNTVKLNYEELLRTINKIVWQIECVINKYYRSFCVENNYPLEYCPTIKIQSTLIMDYDTKLRLVDTLYSKIGVSYKTAFEILDVNYDEEIIRRKAENDNNFDEELFLPHANSYTSNSNELLNGDSTKNKNGSKKSNNTDKSLEDKQRNEGNV